jgi:hypothetical protein
MGWRVRCISGKTEEEEEEEEGEEKKFKRSFVEKEKNRLLELYAK